MAEREPWDDSPLDDTLLDESDADFEKRTASDDDEVDDDGTVEEEGGEGSPDVDPNVDSVINYIARQESLKERKAAESAAFVAEMETHLPGYQAPREEPLSKMELAGQKAAALVGTPAFEEFAQMLRTANAEQERQYRASQEGYDEDGEPVAVDAPFSPSELSTDDFNHFVAAVTAGGASADPRRRPAGESFESWQRKVNSALGR